MYKKGDIIEFISDKDYGHVNSVNYKENDINISYYDVDMNYDGRSSFSIYNYLIITDIFRDDEL
jgi:hypothetical protein